MCTRKLTEELREDFLADHKKAVGPDYSQKSLKEIGNEEKIASDKGGIEYLRNCVASLHAQVRELTKELSDARADHSKMRSDLTDKIVFINLLSSELGKKNAELASIAASLDICDMKIATSEELTDPLNAKGTKAVLQGIIDNVREVIKT